MHYLESQHYRTRLHSLPAIILALLFNGPQNLISPSLELIDDLQLGFGREQWNDLIDGNFGFDRCLRRLNFSRISLLCATLQRKDLVLCSR